MTVGVVILVHDDFDRAELVIRLWVAGECPVIVHVDRSVDDQTFDAFVKSLDDLDHVRFSKRHRCAWGTWGLVAATLDAATLLLRDFSAVRHVYLASGSCLPLRPISELRAFLDASPTTDFIESATTADVPWTVGGLDRERFTLRFPLSWKTHRRLFDGYVRLQRRIGVSRQIPEGLVPHMGSQWWCLTRDTISAILNDPRRPIYDRYFKRVWIPDESYFQTLSRLHGKEIQSRSLTLAKFDYHGKPHIFYDDHAEILRRSGSFVARKIWRDANTLYQSFPRASDPGSLNTIPNTNTVDRIFGKARERRAHGRPGLYMQSRFPSSTHANGISAAPYTVVQGFDDVFPNFSGWLAQETPAQVHGHLFGQDKAHFSGGAAIYRGGLSDVARLRDYNAEGFLKTLIWNGRENRQCFQFGPADAQRISGMLTQDTNARLWIISGAWAIPLFMSGRSAAEVRTEAGRLQRREHRFLKSVTSPQTRARVRLYTLAEFLEQPLDIMQGLIDEMAGHRARELTSLPEMHNFEGLPRFLQELKNHGMHPFLTGDLSALPAAQPARIAAPKTYVATRK